MICFAASRRDCVADNFGVSVSGILLTIYAPTNPIILPVTIIALKVLMVSEYSKRILKRHKDIKYEDVKNRKLREIKFPLSSLVVISPRRGVHATIPTLLKA